MKPLGHVGIAVATSIAAFVSLYQYIHGLKKRNFWTLRKPLLIQIKNIIISTFVMGIVIYIIKYLLNIAFPSHGIFVLILKLAIIGTIGLATFLILAKITGIMDIKSIIQNILMRRKKA
jgi:putative peptidoglycan lipid II flippase